MAERYICNSCEKVEEYCKCDRYCYLCQSEHEVRLVENGCYYCLECREACDYLPERDRMHRTS
jgi:sulfur transfer complex TusBCD TusB component (DsrH family)